MRFDFSRLACILAAVGSTAGVASAGVVEVVYGIAAQAPASPKSAVPGGLVGVDDARFTNFNNKLYRSPTTNMFITVPTTNGTPTSADQVLLIGSGLTGTIAAREGVTSIGTNPGSGQPEFINFSSLSVPRLNDSDAWAMGFRLLGGTISDDRLVRFSGGVFTVFRGGDAAPGGGSYFGSFNSGNIANDGTLGYLAAVAPNGAASESAFIGSARVIDVFVDAPTGQSTPPQVWADLDANSFFQDATGTHYIVLGKVGQDANIDRVVVVDGDVKIQKGSIVPGSSFTAPVSAISTANDGVWMESDGTWFAWGTNTDGEAWMVRNGVVIARSTAGITLGSTELWETFRSVRGADNGSYVINGNTNAPTLTDDVLVLNGQTVVARESDDVDLDNNGVFDDGLNVHLVQNHMVLMNDGYVYFVARLKSGPTATGGANGSNNASLLRVRAFTTGPVCGDADFNGDGDVGTDADIEAFFACLGGNCCATCFPGGADFNGDGDVGTDADIESFFRVLAGGPC